MIPAPRNPGPNPSPGVLARMKAAGMPDPPGTFYIAGRRIGNQYRAGCCGGKATPPAIRVVTTPQPA